MNNKDIMHFAELINKHLDAKKSFVANKQRLAEIEQASKIASKLFADAKISLKDDPLQLGSISVHIDCFDMIVRGKDEIKLFIELIERADNFETYAKDNGNIVISIMFNNAFIRVIE